MPDKKCLYCGSNMTYPGGHFPASPVQNAMCTSCGARNYNGTWYTKKEWAEYVEVLEDQK